MTEAETDYVIQSVQEAVAEISGAMAQDVNQ